MSKMIMMIIIMGSAAAIFSIATSVKEGLEKLVTQVLLLTVVVRMHVKKTTFSITFFFFFKEEGKSTLC